MKEKAIAIGSIVISALLVIFIFSCHPTKKGQSVASPYIITLADGLSGKYFEANYPDFQPSEIKKSNRTLNQYRVVFTGSSKTLKELQKKLKADSNIAEVIISDEKGTDIQTNTNQGHSKVKPIKSNDN